MKAIQSVAVGVLCLLAGLSNVNAATISFGDPGLNNGLRWFAVDLVNDLITADWPDANPNGITLLKDGIPQYAGAFFTMTNLNYTGTLGGGYTAAGSYSIKFYEDGANTGTDAPVFQIDFQQVYVNFYGVGGSNLDLFNALGVEFSGALVGTAAGVKADLAEESFAFSFVNPKALGGSYATGLTSTASFNASYIPEPATVGLVALGGALLRRRK